MRHHPAAKTAAGCCSTRQLAGLAQSCSAAGAGTTAATSGTTRALLLLLLLLPCCQECLQPLPAFFLAAAGATYTLLVLAQLTAAYLTSSTCLPCFH